MAHVHYPTTKEKYGIPAKTPTSPQIFSLWITEHRASMPASEPTALTFRKQFSCRWLLPFHICTLHMVTSAHLHNLLFITQSILLIKSHGDKLYVYSLVMTTFVCREQTAFQTFPVWPYNDRNVQHCIRAFCRSFAYISLSQSADFFTYLTLFFILVCLVWYGLFCVWYASMNYYYATWYI